MTLSKSPDRNSFHKSRYVERKQELGEEPSEDYLEMFKTIEQHKAELEADTEWQKDNLEWDLRTTEWMLDKVRGNDIYAQNLYAAICNNEFQKRDVMPILSNKTWSASWRYAGGIIADMRGSGDYIDWYCSGIQNRTDLDDESYNALTKEQQEYYIITKSYVSESVVTDEIRDDLLKLGWNVIDSGETDV